MNKNNDLENKIELLKDENLGVENNPWKTIAIYIVFGFLWILFSDQILSMIITDHEQFIKFQTVKGSFYVLFTGGLLYILIRFDNKRIFNLSKSLHEKNQDLVSFSEELIAVEEELQQRIIELSKSMNSLENHKKYIDEIINNNNTIILIWNLDGTVIDVNDFFVEITMYEKEEIIGQQWADFIHPDNCFETQVFIDKLKKSNSLRNSESEIVTKNGKSLSILWNDKVIENPNTDEYFIVSFGVDVTLKKENEKRIYEMAFTDKLTRLKNKVVFENDLEKMIELEEPFTLYYLDFDNFKHLNDTLGHGYGDQFLTDYSKVLLKEFPHLDVYRWSGDEFSLIQKSNNRLDINATIETLMNITQKKWIVSQMEYYPSVSMGITQYPTDADSVSSLMQNVELALYKSKQTGKSQYKFYEAYFQSEVERSIKIESLINRVIQSNDFLLHFQPIYELKDCSIIGFEALLRWHSDDQTFNTGDFITVAEKTGQIIEIDRWVLTNAFQFIQKNFSNDNYMISINLSAKSLTSSFLIDYISENIKAFQIDPSRVEFEVTEHSLIDNFDVSLNVIKALKKLGFRISLDDFGTRFSSLNYLSKIPFDTLKIDKTYIDHITEGGSNQIIVEQIIQLSLRLGLKTIAEGIETTAQKNKLEQLGCIHGQGYLMSKPLSSENLLKLLKH